MFFDLGMRYSRAMSLRVARSQVSDGGGHLRLDVTSFREITEVTADGRPLRREAANRTWTRRVPLAFGVNPSEVAQQYIGSLDAVALRERSPAGLVLSVHAGGQVVVRDVSDTESDITLFISDLG